MKKVYLENYDAVATGYRIGRRLFIRYISPSRCSACGATGYHDCPAPQFIVVAGQRYYEYRPNFQPYAEDNGVIIYVRKPIRSVEAILKDASVEAQKLPELIAVDGKIYEVRK